MKIFKIMFFEIRKYFFVKFFAWSSWYDLRNLKSRKFYNFAFYFLIKFLSTFHIFREFSEIKKNIFFFVENFPIFFCQIQLNLRSVFCKFCELILKISKEKNLFKIPKFFPFQRIRCRKKFFVYFLGK